MPSFKDKLGSAATTAKFIADQQMRVMRVQNNIKDVENQVKSQTTALGSAALELYAQGGLSEESLQELCAKIASLNEQIEQLKENLRQIQAEVPPSEGQNQAE